MDLHELAPVDRRATGARDGRGLKRLAEVCENLPDRPRLRDEGNEPDVATTPRALERKLLPHPGHQLIVEFARQREAEGVPRADAVLEAAKLRLRPILMTSLAFILGVVPLVLGKGAGAEMRVALGTAVFSGMLGVTVFGIFFTPVFYSVVMWFAGRPAGARS